MLGAFAAVAVLLTGTACATSATAAAVVGDVSIPEQAIFDRSVAFSGQLQEQGQPALSVYGLAYLNRLQATAAIRSELLRIAAQDRGVEVTDAQVNAAMANRAPGSRAEAQDYRDQLRLEGLLTASADRPLSFTNVTVVIDGVRVSTEDQARQLREQLLALPAGSPLPALDSQAQALPTGSVDLLSNRLSVWDGVLEAEQGAVLINQGSDGFYVVRVLDRAQAPAEVSAAQILRVQDLTTQHEIAAAALLQPYAEQAGVTVNPRMGEWDQLAMRVVPTTRDL